MIKVPAYFLDKKQSFYFPSRFGFRDDEDYRLIFIKNSSSSGISNLCMVVSSPFESTVITFIILQSFPCAWNLLGSPSGLFEANQVFYQFPHIE